MSNDTAQGKLIGTSPAGVEYRAYERHSDGDIVIMRAVLAERWARHNAKRTDRVRVRNLTSAQMYHVTDHVQLVAEAEGVPADAIESGATYIEAPGHVIWKASTRLEDDAEFHNPAHAQNEGWNPNCDNLAEAKFSVRQTRKSLEAAARKCREALRN